MAEETKDKVAELEERLTKATNVYKAQKEELEKAYAYIKELENAKSEGVGGEDTTALKERIKELEDEIVINGNSADVIKGLNERLEKAKTVFAEQKEKIASSKKENEELKSKVSEYAEAIKKLEKDNSDKANMLSNYEDAMKTIKGAIAGF